MAFAHVVHLFVTEKDKAAKVAEAKLKEKRSGKQ